MVKYDIKGDVCKSGRGTESFEQKTLMWELIRKKYPNAKPEEIYDARQRHPENWLDVLEELEK